MTNPKSPATKSYATKLSARHADVLSNLVRLGTYPSQRAMLEEWTEKFLADNPEISDQLEQFEKLSLATQTSLKLKKEILTVEKAKRCGVKQDELEAVLSFAHKRAETLAAYEKGMYVFTSGEPFSYAVIKSVNQLK